jgi:hypothetical protein
MFLIIILRIDYELKLTLSGKPEKYQPAIAGYSSLQLIY